MAIRKAKQESKNAKYGDQRVETYYFDVEKCKIVLSKKDAIKKVQNQKHIV